jgi:hypothetical protein
MFTSSPSSIITFTWSGPRWVAGDIIFFFDYGPLLLTLFPSRSHEIQCPVDFSFPFPTLLESTPNLFFSQLS